MRRLQLTVNSGGEMNVVGGDEYITRSMTVSHLFTDQYAARTCIDRVMHAIYSPVDPCTRLRRAHLATVLFRLTAHESRMRWINLTPMRRDVIVTS